MVLMVTRMIYCNVVHDVSRLRGCINCNGDGGSGGTDGDGGEDCGGADGDGGDDCGGADGTNGDSNDHLQWGAWCFTPPWWQ